MNALEYNGIACNRRGCSWKGRNVREYERHKSEVHA